MPGRSSGNEVWIGEKCTWGPLSQAKDRKPGSRTAGATPSLQGPQEAPRVSCGWRGGRRGLMAQSVPPMKIPNDPKQKSGQVNLHFVGSVRKAI